MVLHWGSGALSTSVLELDLGEGHGAHASTNAGCVSGLKVLWFGRISQAAVSFLWAETAKTVLVSKWGIHRKLGAAGLRVPVTSSVQNSSEVRRLPTGDSHRWRLLLKDLDLRLFLYQLLAFIGHRPELCQGQTWPGDSPTESLGPR